MERQTKIDGVVWSGVERFVLTRKTPTLQDRTGQGGLKAISTGLPHLYLWFGYQVIR